LNRIYDSASCFIADSATGFEVTLLVEKGSAVFRYISIVRLSLIEGAACNVEDSSVKDGIVADVI
jgi:hypothetical protein